MLKLGLLAAAPNRDPISSYSRLCPPPLGQWNGTLKHVATMQYLSQLIFSSAATPLMYWSGQAELDPSRALHVASLTCCFRHLLPTHGHGPTLELRYDSRKTLKSRIAHLQGYSQASLLSRDVMQMQNA